MGSLIHFGPFEADLEAGELRKFGLKIKLQDQPFQILSMLLERPGQVVTREELHKKLWPADTFVDFDRGLNRAVNRLRDALGDSADVPRFVETLPKHGYRFVAPVKGTASPSELPESPPETLHVLAPSRTRLWARVLVIVLLTAAAAAYYYTRRPVVLTERDTVVLADFDNRAGEPAFDYTLKQALVIDLEQSPFLKILPDQQVTNTLRLMLRDPDQRLTEDTARTVCQRIGSKAVLAGSIASLGSEYVIGLRAMNCETGDMLAQEQARADRKEEVLNALDRAASALRRKLGESLSSIRKYDRPTHEALSTASLDAFQAYANGERIVQRQGSRLAIPLMRRATELDPNFAYAHSALGLIYGTLGEAKLSAESTGKAYALRESVSEWEKFFISMEYHLQVTGELEKAVALGQVWSQNYPRERTAHNRLAYAYRQLGQYESALAEIQQARRLGGDNFIDVGALARTYMVLDRLPEARSLVDDALARNPGQVNVRQLVYSLSFLDGDLKRMQEQVDWAIGKPGADILLASDSDTEGYFGRLEKARELSRRAEESSLHDDFKERSALLHGMEAVREADFGNVEAARGHVRIALAAEPGPDTLVLAALALAKAGDTGEARKLVDQLNAQLPTATLIQNYWLPAIQAEIELQAGNPSRAIELLHKAESYELADTSVPMIPVYVRAEAYLRRKQGEPAAVEFQKILQHRGLIGNSPLGALARLGLARVYALSGDTSSARTRYQDFFTLWKDADPEVSVLREARAEYGRL